MRKNNRKKYFLITGLVLILLVLLFGILYYVNNSKNNYSFAEKNWINSNVDNIKNVNVQSDLPIFSENGEGVFYDYLREMEKDTGLTFNITVSSDGNSSESYKLLNKNDIDKNDLVFYTDHYVVISKSDKQLVDLSNINEQLIGVIGEDKEYVSKYLSDYNFEIQDYDNFTKMDEEMNHSIYYAIIPMYRYMTDIVYNKYNIVYHIEGLHSHYVLSKSVDNDILSNVLTKFYNKWEDEIYTNINKHFLALYYKSNSLSELERETITGDDLLVGYIENMPYEGKINNHFSGVTNEYLSLFADMTGATYKYIKYNDLNKLTEALNSKKVDLVLNYYNISSPSYQSSVGLGNINYVIIAHHDNVIPVESLESIKDDNIKMVKNTKLYNFIKDKQMEVQDYDNYRELFKDMNNRDVIIMEKSTFDFYKNSKLKNYVIKYIGTSDVSNSFLLNNDNRVLNDMFNFYLTTLGNKSVHNMAVRDSLQDVNANVIIQFVISNITYILILGLAIAFLLFKFNRKVKVTKKIKKEDKMMYLDIMTNLKNRNYLNDNLNYWESNKIYPQSIVVVDLNNISTINDTKGHEEGDKQIKGAAGILIKTQRENSEIIRTDGNEFLIYLVGYEEKQIVTYVNKLLKEFKNLPYEYGASVGYSMINAESTTIDDAINEALIMMRRNKGEK